VNCSINPGSQKLALHSGDLEARFVNSERLVNSVRPRQLVIPQSRVLNEIAQAMA